MAFSFINNKAINSRLEVSLWNLQSSSKNYSWQCYLNNSVSIMIATIFSTNETRGIETIWNYFFLVRQILNITFVALVYVYIYYQDDQIYVKRRIDFFPSSV